MQPGLRRERSLLPFRAAGGGKGAGRPRGTSKTAAPHGQRRLRGLRGIPGIWGSRGPWDPGVCGIQGYVRSRGPWDPGICGIRGSVGSRGLWEPPRPACPEPGVGALGIGALLFGDSLQEGARGCFSLPAREQWRSAVGRKAAPPPPVFKRGRSPRAWLLHWITQSSSPSCRGLVWGSPHSRLSQEQLCPSGTETQLQRL